MEKHDFIKRIEELKPILWGKWREVAKKAGVDYHTVQNYSKGYATSSDIRKKIVDAAEEVIKEMQSLINETI